MIPIREFAAAKCPNCDKELFVVTRHDMNEISEIHTVEAITEKKASFLKAISESGASERQKKELLETFVQPGTLIDPLQIENILSVLPPAKVEAQAEKKEDSPEVTP